MFLKALYKYYNFFAKNVSILTLSGFREYLLGVTTFPDVLNSCSDAELVAQTLKYFFASCDINGNLVLYNFHHGRIPSSASNCGSDK